MFVIINGVKQVWRMPGKTILFLILLIISSAFISIGSTLLIESENKMQAFESSFNTIGTVRQKPNILKERSRWDAGLKTYSYSSHPVYDSEIPVSVLNFEDAGYVHAPEKRPHYGAYLEGYIVGEYDGGDVGIVLEVEPFEDCVPSKPVKLRVKKKLWGNVGNSDEIWFCDHFNDKPNPMYAGKTYIMSVSRYPLFTHDGFDSYEYYPTNEIFSSQYDKSGARIPDELWEYTGDWEEVTDGYYNTPRGQRWFELIEGFKRFRQTLPVAPTNATYLLMDFFNGNANIIAGRDISEEEYRAGSKVCLIQQGFAKKNGLSVGDILPLPMYYADYRRAPSQAFLPTGGAGINFGLVNSEGKLYPVFEDGKYRIVGIYETTVKQYNVAGFESGKNMVVIPALSVENSDENNIVDYGPMQAYNSSFEIPNGKIDEYITKFNQQGITGLEIEFYDKGYSQLQDGLNRMRNISIILMLIGSIAMLLVLTFFTYLFIVKNKKRTAIERSLGISRKACMLSILSGMLMLSILGISAGVGSGYFLGNTVMKIVNIVETAGAYNLAFSNWSNNADKIAQIQMDLQQTGLSVFFAIGFAIFTVSVIIAFIGIRMNLKCEPLTLLSSREDE